MPTATKNGTLMRQVINKINGIDFNASDDRHMFSDIYERSSRISSPWECSEVSPPRCPSSSLSRSTLGETILDPAWHWRLSRVRD
jgi:type I restriction enzyme M protein